MDHARAVQQHTPIERDDEEVLTRRVVELAVVSGRYGMPRITAMARRAGRVVNHKRFERI